MSRPIWTVIQHVEFEHPGLIAEVASQHDVGLDVRRMDLGDELPPPDAPAGLVVLGGPMAALDDAEFPFLRAERELLAEAVERDIPVLGVCLGAQLLATALGAELVEGSALEVGLGEVTVVTDDHVLGAAGESLPVFHWHADTFTMPVGATLLARSDRFAHQAFRIGGHAYGLQFHVEVDHALAASLAPHLPGDVSLTHSARTAVEAAGRKALNRFFAAVL